MKRRFFATALFMGAMFTQQLMASDQTQGQQGQQGQQAQGQYDQEEDVADTLLIKVKLDDKDNEILTEAVLIPLHVKVRLRSTGIDVSSLENDCDSSMHASEQIPLSPGSFANQQLPKTVQEEFDYADSLMDMEAVSWRVWTPYGSIGSGRGYYGYGHYPYYGHHRSYGSYYPRWGYYRGGRHYPYYYGHSRRLDGYSYHYYYR